MSGPTIETPRGGIFLNEDGTKAKLVWNTNFQPNWQENYSRAQKYVDSEVLRLSEPYIPLQTGMLVKSGILGTEIGSGMVEWIAPYARYQYYHPRKTGTETGPLRGPHWFERGKAVWKRDVIAGARRRAGGSQ